MRAPSLLAALVILLVSNTVTRAQSETLALVQKDGLLVLLPGIAGPRSYGTYLVPNALGRESLSR